MTDSKNNKTKNELDYDRGIREIDKLKSRAMKEKLEKQQSNTLSEMEMFDLEQMVKEASKKSAVSSKSKCRVLNNFSFRKNLATIFRKLNQDNGINYNNYITIRYKSINYNHRNSGEQSLNALETSLIHSSRQEKRRVEEWIDSQSHNNIYYATRQYLTHDEFIRNREQHLSFLYNIQQTANNKSDQNHKLALSKYSRYRSSYFCKIKKLLPTAHPQQAKFLEKITKLESQQNRDIDLSKPPHSHVISKIRTYLENQYQQLGLSQKHQENKIRIFDNYLSHREKHQALKLSASNRSVKNKNSTSISEQVIKIPHKYGEFKDIEKQHILETCVNFFTDNFDVNIEFAALHADEGLNENIESGLNAHIFISPTGSSTWSQQYISFAQKQAKLHYSDNFSELIKIDPNKKLPPHILISCGQVLQLSLLQNLQEKIFNHHDVGIRFLEECERKEFNNIQAMIEENLPIHLRQQSRFNMLNDKSNNLSQNIAIQSAKLDSIQNITNQQLKIILQAIDLWKLKPTPEIASLTLFRLEMLDDLPTDVKNALIDEITLFEQRNGIDSNVRLSNKINKP